MRKPIALIISGYHESPTYVVWEMVKDNLERKGYEVIGCKPNWKEGTHSDWLKELFPEMGDKEIDLVIGYSYIPMDR